MKWFWKINLGFTFYYLLILILLFKIGAEKDYGLNEIRDILTFNDFLTPPIMIIEWIQVPLFLIVMFFWKEQRTKGHFLYMASLVALNFIKWILWALAVGGVTTT